MPRAEARNGGRRHKVFDGFIIEVVEVGPGPGGLTRALLAEGAREILECVYAEPARDAAV